MTEVLRPLGAGETRSSHTHTQWASLKAGVSYACSETYPGSFHLTPIKAPHLPLPLGPLPLEHSSAGPSCLSGAKNALPWVGRIPSSLALCPLWGDLGLRAHTSTEDAMNTIHSLSITSLHQEF